MGELDEVSYQIQSFIRQIPPRWIRLRIYRAVFSDQQLFLYLAESAQAGSHCFANAPRVEWHTRAHGNSPVSICHAKRVPDWLSERFADPRAGKSNPRQCDPFPYPAVQQLAAERQNRLHLFC